MITINTFIFIVIISIVILITLCVWSVMMIQFIKAMRENQRLKSGKPSQEKDNIEK